MFDESSQLKADSESEIHIADLKPETSVGWIFEHKHLRLKHKQAVCTTTEHKRDLPDFFRKIGQNKLYSDKRKKINT